MLGFKGDILPPSGLSETENSEMISPCRVLFDGLFPVFPSPQGLKVGEVGRPRCAFVGWAIPVVLPLPVLGVRGIWPLLRSGIGG